MSKYSKIADVEENLDNEHDQLEFQNFVLNSAEQNLTSGNFKAQSQPTQNRDNQNFGFSTGQPNNNNQDQNKQQHAFYTLEYYMTFFDVDTNDVKSRVLATFNPRNNSNFYDLVKSNPDLYGPFWISTSVIICLFVSSSLAQTIDNLYQKKTETFNNFAILPAALGTVYTYISVVPAIVWGLSKFFRFDLTFLESLNIYGYGLSIWIPISFFCISTWNSIRWLAILLGFLLSVYFMLQNFTPLVVKSTDNRAKTVTLLFIFLSHLTLALLFKFSFFFPFESVANSPST